jgi:hypothetical protein
LRRTLLQPLQARLTGLDILLRRSLAPLRPLLALQPAQFAPLGAVQAALRRTLLQLLQSRLTGLDILLRRSLARAALCSRRNSRRSAQRCGCSLPAAAVAALRCAACC